MCDGATADAVIVSGAGTAICCNMTNPLAGFHQNNRIPLILSVRTTETVSIVAIAGKADCNGIYKKAHPPPHASGPFFQKDAQHQMYAFEGEWRIGVMSQMLDYTSDLVSPGGSPTGNWSVAKAQAPAPRLQCQPANSTVPCRTTPSPSPSPHPGPPPSIDLSTPPGVGDALKMMSCVKTPASGSLRQNWAACTGASCWPPGSPDAAHRTNLWNSASGLGFASGSGSGVNTTGRLCVDSLGGAPGWSVRVYVHMQPLRLVPRPVLT